MIAFTIPLKTISGANAREHWGAKARRIKRERSRTLLAALVAGSTRWAQRQLPCTVTLTRLGGKTLDQGDNLPFALKSVRDALAELLGVDDGDARVRWLYAQRIAPRIGRRVQYAVTVEILPEVER